MTEKHRSMSSRRRYRRSKLSPESSSSGSRWSNSHSSMRASTTQTDDDDVHGGHRRLKRSSAWLPVRRSPASHHSWVLLNRAGARRAGFPADRTTSATSRTSKGQEISVSFELAEPPGTSVLTIDDWLQASTTSTEFSGNVIAAHGDVVLLAITLDEKASGRWYTSRPSDSVIDLFVYQASLDASGPRRPSMLLLPSAGGPTVYSCFLDNGEIGVMSCTGNDDVDESPSFVVAQLELYRGKGNAVCLFRPGSGQWESFKNLHVHGANGGRDLEWWQTEAVVPYARRDMMIWVDYYRGMVLMDLLAQSEKTTNTPPPPRLRYVPLPVDSVGDPEDIDFGRGSPKRSRRVCVTRFGVKFVSVDSQHWSNFGVGHSNVLKWNHTFRITIWSLREDDDDVYTWRKDVTMHEEEFWDAFSGRDRFGFPHVQPSFPVVDPDNPDVIIFRLEKPGLHYCGEPKWMIEVDLRKKVLLAATAYSKKWSDDTKDINSARMESHVDPILSEFPRYLDGGQACKKRRQ